MANEFPTESEPQKGAYGFFAKILSLIFSGDDPDKERRRIIKELGKILSKSKYKFYKPRSEEALPKLARLFYGIYKLIAPAQVMLDHADSSQIFKFILIENEFTEEQMALKDSFSEEAIRELIKSRSDRKEAVSGIKDNLVKLYSIFDSDRSRKIENTYALFKIFIEFINLDYYFILRKFDSRFPENDFNYNPNFEAINGDYVSEDLKDFLEYFPLINLDSDWDSLFDALQVYKGTDVISRGSWKKMVRNLSEINRSHVLEQIVKHIDQNPAYKPITQFSSENIVESYLNKLKTQTEMTIQKVIQEERSDKIDKLVIQVFGTTAVSRLNYYTDKANLSFQKKMLGGFLHVVPLNYLKAFLLDYVKKDVRDVVNLLIVKGEWPVRITSQQLSESFASLLQTAEELVAFDESLSQEGEVGSQLWTVFKRSDRDPNSMTVLRQKLKELNDKAYGYIQQSGRNLVVIGKNLKACIEDYEKVTPEMITNWKQIDASHPGDVKTELVECYKKLYYFIQLIQQYLKKKTTNDEK
ncbi:MAG: hypothetical protein JEY99_02220 [Spirochaetales bacterium]|nr:hypothetical protein [Spirochaetales bacterium]